MISFNNCVFVGNVGRTPELQKTDEGTSYARFSLAVDQYAGKDEAGKTKDSAMWLNIVAWRGLSESVAKVVRKGSLVLVNGKLSIRPYTDKEGVEKTSVEIIANAVQILGSKAKEETSSEEPTSQAA